MIVARNNTVDNFLHIFLLYINNSGVDEKFVSRVVIIPHDLYIESWVNVFFLILYE